MSAEENKKLMKSLDDAWNRQDWDTFSKLHTDDLIVRWPGQPPTKGIDAHRKEGEYFFRHFRTTALETIPIKYFLLRMIGHAP